MAHEIHFHGDGHTDSTALLPPHEVPPPVPDFVGRVDEIGAAEARLLTGELPSKVVLLHGPGAIGKSEIAYSIAHSETVFSAYPDGHIYLDLRGEGNQPLPPGSAVTSLLGGLGVPAGEIPANLQQAENLYRTKLYDRSSLVLLDNAHEISQFEHLLPPSPASALIVTSRRPLSIPGAFSIEVKPMGIDDDHSDRDLLLSILGNDESNDDAGSIAAVLESCGGFPLAIRIAGSVAHRRGWSASFLAEKLAQTRLDLMEDSLGASDFTAQNSVRLSFQLSYELLDDDTQRLYRRLGTVGLPEFGADFAAGLDGQDSDATKSRLYRLQDEHLLESAGADRFQLHDLLREYARERAIDEEETSDLATTQDKAINWYVISATRMNHLMYADERWKVAEGIAATTGEPVGTVHANLELVAIRWFDLEYDNLRQTFELAQLVNAPHHMQALLLSIQVYADLRSRWIDALQMVQSVLMVTTEASRKAPFLNFQASCYAHLEDVESAQLAIQNALKIFRDLGDERGEWLALNNFGNIYKDLGEWDLAISVLEQSLELATTLNDSQGRTATLKNLAGVYRLKGQFNKALSSYEAAIELQRGIGDRIGLASSLQGIANVFEQMDSLREAERALQESIELRRQLGDTSGLGFTLQGIGNLYFKREEWEESLRMYEEALSIFEETNNRRAIAATLGSIGNALRRQLQSDQAIARYEIALTIYEEIDDRHGMSLTLLNLGNAHRMKHCWRFASKAYRDALALARELKDDDTASIIQHNLDSLQQEMDL